MSESSYQERLAADSAIRATSGTENCPERCTICLEALTTTLPADATYTKSDSEPDVSESPRLATTIIRCGHIYCRRCIIKWLRLNNTCPSCRVTCYPRTTDNSLFESVMHEYNVVVSTARQQGSRSSVRVFVNGQRVSESGLDEGAVGNVEEENREPGGWSHHWMRRYYDRDM
jgi:hypothetical protein